MTSSSRFNFCSRGIHTSPLTDAVINHDHYLYLYL